MNQKGLTVIEMLVVLVIIGVVSTFAVINFTGLQSRTNIKADTHNVNVLNSVTQRYADFSVVTNNDVFDGITTDEERMTKLVTEGFLNHVPRPAQNGASFVWDVSAQSWGLDGGELDGTFTASSVVSYTFDVDTKETLLNSGALFRNESNWVSENGVLENKPGEQRLFIPIGKDTYTITVNASLTSGNSGGYGIFFDTTLDEGNVNRDNGLIFQFDRGYGNGSMIVRPRVNGRERSPVWVLRDHQTDVFPSKRDDADWWTESHQIKIVVTNVSDTERQAEFFIDGESIGTYTYDNAVDGEIIYTGFRTWTGQTTQFESIDVN